MQVYLVIFYLHGKGTVSEYNYHSNHWGVYPVHICLVEFLVN